MKHRWVFFLIFALVVSALSVLPGIQAQPATSPAPMFRFNYAHTGQSAFAGPTRPEIRWSFKTGYRISGTPAIGPDGTIYIGSGDRHLYALSPEGKVKWSYDCLFGGAVDSSPAVSSTSTIYFGSGTFFYALDQNGKEILYVPTYVSSLLSSPIIGEDGTVYFGGVNGKLYAMSPDLRKTSWTFSAGGPILSSPARDPSGNLYFGAEDGYLYSLTPSGTVRWKFKCEGGIESSPVLDSAGNVYFGSKDFSFYSLDPYGSLRWTFRTEGSVTSSAGLSREGALYFGSYDGSLYALSTETGTRLWSYKTEYPIDTSPTVDLNGNIYFGGQGKNFYCLRKDGELIWRMTFPNAFSRSSAVIDQLGLLYVGCQDGSLYCIGSSQQEPVTPTPPVTETPSPLFLLSVSPPQADLYPGGSALFAVNVHPLVSSTFSGKLEAFYTPGLSVNLSQTEFSLEGQDLQVLLNLTVPPGFPPGTYFLELKATSGAFEAKGAIQIVIKVPAFPDVPTEYWAFSAVGLLTERGVINGYPDGTFRPENKVTRAEFAKMILLTFNLSPVSTSVTTFPDAPISHWAHSYIEAAVAYGLVQGYPDGTFRPEGSVTLAEAITLIVRATRWQLEAPPSIFTREAGIVRPVQPTDWYYLYAGSAFKNGLLKLEDPYLVEKVASSSVMAFNDPASRAQIAVLLSRVLP